MSSAKDSEGASSSTATKDENANGRDTTNKHNGTKANQSTNGSKPIKRCKLVIVGDGCCGKTSLLTVFKRYWHFTQIKFQINIL